MASREPGAVEVMVQKIDYTQKPISKNLSRAGIDFSNQDVINDPNKDVQMITYYKPPIGCRSSKNSGLLGSYLPEIDLQKIIGRDTKNRDYYFLIDTIRKNDKLTIELNKDFDLLRDFFPGKITNDVQKFCKKIMPEIIAHYSETKTNFTPRKRRRYILAIYQSFCRTIGWKFTKNIVKLINDRFNYIRGLFTLFEICDAETNLVNLGIIKKYSPNNGDNLKIFFNNVIHNINRMKEQQIIKSNSIYSDLLDLTKKYIFNLVKDKDQKENLGNYIRCQDKDFAARMVIWVCINKFAEMNFGIIYKYSKLPKGWKDLFLINGEVPIRSLDYIAWTFFDTKKKLKELGLFPKEDFY